MYNNFLINLLSNTLERRLFLDRIYFLPRRLKDILATIKSFKQSKIFLNKVSKKEAPDYYDVIKNPMDLSVVQRKIGMYKSFEEFKADLDLIWNNCLEYNEGKYYRDCAIRMMELVSTLEIEKTPVTRDEVLPSTLGNVEGYANDGPIIGDMIKKLICGVLLSSGYAFSSKSALETFSDVFQDKIMKIIEEVCEEKDSMIEKKTF